MSNKKTGRIKSLPNGAMQQQLKEDARMTLQIRVTLMEMASKSWWPWGAVGRAQAMYDWVMYKNLKTAEGPKPEAKQEIETEK